MRTPGPAAGPAFPFQKLLSHAFYMLRPRFRLFHNGGPADPLVTRERCKVVPLLQNFRVRGNCLAHVGRDSVNNAGSDGGFCHLDLQY